MSQQLSTSLPAPPIRSRSSFRGDIQGLRALAVGVVVLYHFWPHRLTGGFVGVDVFFVISGFLITAHLISTPPRTAKDVGKFWMRRVRRLLPASFLVILSSILAVGLWHLPPSGG
ncbi:acyltransferase [Glutamicibacter creatinolyticus]|uniref:acyltransferase family protein n=1 Tax=Glutamicibacter creatinolyticus TaxID=162496 RepID=UPI0031D16944